MSNLKTNDEIVKLLWPTIKDSMVYLVQETDKYETVFRTTEYNGILEIKNNGDNEMIPIYCYGSDNDGNEFELSDQYLDELYLQIKEEGYYNVVDSYDYDDDDQDWYK